MENLIGGAQTDIFRMHEDGHMGGSVIGGSGTNVLDYSYYPVDFIGNGVDVDLRNGSATSIGWVTDFTVLIGTSGRDTLHGGEANEILIGGDGQDSLLAAGGRDLCFGGSGGDSIHAGNDDDIIISGKTAYYVESSKALNLAALTAIMAEWARTDIGYSTRVSHIRDGGGINGSYRLNSSTCFRDNAIDLLYGESGRDWFLATSRDLDHALDRVLWGSGAETWTGI